MAKNKPDRERQERLTALKKLFQRVAPAGIPGERYGTNRKLEQLIQERGLTAELLDSPDLPTETGLVELLAEPVRSVEASEVVAADVPAPKPAVEQMPTVALPAPPTEARDAEYRMIEEPTLPQPAQPAPTPTVEVHIINVVEQSVPAPTGDAPAYSQPLDEPGVFAESAGGTDDASDPSAEAPAGDVDTDSMGLPEADDAAGETGVSEDSDGLGDDGAAATADDALAAAATDAGHPGAAATGDDSPPERRRRSSDAKGGSSSRRRPKSGANPPWAIVTAAAAVGLLLLVGAILLRQLATGSASVNDELARMKQQRDASRIAASTAAAEAEAAKELQRAAEAKVATAQAEKATAIADHEAAKLLQQRRMSLKDLATERAQEVAQRHGIDLTQLQSSTQRDLDLLAARLENEQLEKEKKMLENKLQQPGGSPLSAGLSAPTTPVAPPAQSLKAEAGGDRTVDVGSAVGFDGSASTGSIQQYRWRFGDGDEASGKTAAHTYLTRSSFMVTLTVTDDRGQTARDSFTVTVK